MPQSLSNKSTTFILLGIALLLPVATVVGGATQWVLITVAVGMLFLCAYNIGVNHRRSGGS